LEQRNVVVVSLLGKKPNGRSEFSYYSFYDEGLSLQQWIDANYGDKAVKVIEHQTCDSRLVPDQVLAAIKSDVLKAWSERRTVVLMDSGGVQRVRQVCKYLGATEDKSPSMPTAV